LSKQLGDDGGLLLRIGKGEGADKAIGLFGFHLPQPPPRYPKIGDVLQKLNQHKIRYRSQFPFGD
jgi:hypothetical protein